MLTLIVDFNAAQDGVVRGLIEEVIDGRELTPGALVLLSDGEGNEALGVIRDVNDGLVYARVDWKTWGPEGAIRIVASQALSKGSASIIESISGAGMSSYGRDSRGGLPTRLEVAEQLAVA
jgi:hypothetical protein